MKHQNGRVHTQKLLPHTSGVYQTTTVRIPKLTSGVMGGATPTSHRQYRLLCENRVSGTCAYNGTKNFIGWRVSIATHNFHILVKGGWLMMSEACSQFTKSHLAATSTYPSLSKECVGSIRICVCDGPRSIYLSGTMGNTYGSICLERGGGTEEFPTTSKGAQDLATPKPTIITTSRTPKERYASLWRAWRQADKELRQCKANSKCHKHG